MNIINIRLYNLFRNDLDLPDARAEEFVDALNELTRVEANNSAMEYKSILKEDMAQLEMALRGDMSSMEMSLRRDMSSMETNLRDEIKDSKIDTIKWMAGIFLALALMILGLYIKK